MFTSHHITLGFLPVVRLLSRNVFLETDVNHSSQFLYFGAYYRVPVEINKEPFNLLVLGGVNVSAPTQEEYLPVKVRGETSLLKSSILRHSKAR